MGGSAGAVELRKRQSLEPGQSQAVKYTITIPRGAWPSTAPSATA